MKLKIRDYKKIENLQLDVEGLVGIIGSNGSGKSTIINALRSVFYNVAGETVRWGAESSAVGVQFEEPLVWRRSGGASSYIFRGKKYEKLGRVVPDEIVQYLNIEPICVEEEKHYVNFFPQLESPLIVRLTPSRLYSLIVKSLDADKIEKASKNVEKYLLDLKEELHLLDLRELDYKQEKEKLEQVLLQTEMVELWKDSFASYEENKAVLDQLKELREQYFKSKKALPLLIQLNEMLQKLEQEIVRFSSMIPKYNELTVLKDIKFRYQPVDKFFLKKVEGGLLKLSSLGSVFEIELNVSNMKRLRQSYNSHRGATEQLVCVSDILSKVDLLLPQYPDDLFSLHSVKDRLTSVVLTKKNLEDVVRELELLTTGKVCPTCGKPLEVNSENSESI